MSSVFTRQAAATRQRVHAAMLDGSVANTARLIPYDGADELPPGICPGSRGPAPPNTDHEDTPQGCGHWQFGTLCQLVVMHRRFVNSVTRDGYGTARELDVAAHQHLRVREAYVTQSHGTALYLYEPSRRPYDRRTVVDTRMLVAYRRLTKPEHAARGSRYADDDDVTRW